MLKEFALDISAEIEYARTWAFSRNPDYADFDRLGGDCTNFISQCVRAGGAPMNYTPDSGWYFSSLGDRAAAWSGVEFFYRFITMNRSVGPFGSLIPTEDVQTGDIIQLGGENDLFYHNLLVVNMRGGEPHVAAHTNDVYDLGLSFYRYDRIRCLRVRSYRKYV